MMRKLRDWLTDSRRTAIQALLATLGVLATQIGWTTEHQNGLILVMTGALLQLLQGLFALAFLRRSEAYTWLTTAGRTAVYGLAAAAAPVAVAVGLIDDATSATLLTAVSSALTAFSALLAVLNAQPTAVLDPFDLDGHADEVLAAHAQLPTADREAAENAATTRVLRRDPL